MASNYESDDGGFYAGQHEPLTVRLRGLIRAYPEGIGIIQELIQNADDAGATVVRITFDWRTHKPEQLPLSRMTELMGPAILVYNNQVFTDKDFQGIQKLGIGSKRDTENLWKTGRFGLGFNAVYNVTDYPSFVSRDRIIVFDPHTSVLENPGRGWFIHPNCSVSDKNERGQFYPDFMQVYQTGLPPGVNDFNNTVFRLPLRTSAHASRSDIWEEPFEKKNVDELLQQLVQSGEHLLIFLKNVEEIHVYQIPEGSNGDSEELLTITTKNAQQVRRERQKLLGVLKREPERLPESCRNKRTNLPPVSYLHEIVMTNGGHITTSTWRVSSVIRFDEKGELIGAIEEMSKQKEKAVPWAGAAARIATSNTKTASQPFKGRAYCFLPLPLETGLPIHINGYFDLDDSRRNLTSADSTTTSNARRLKVSWNQLLVSHVLSHACANLIADLVLDVGTNRPNDFYTLWPLSNDLPQSLKALPNHVVRLLHRKNVIRSTGNNGWGEPSNVYVLPENGKDLMEPLCAEGLAFPDPPLPPQIVSAFDAVGLSLKILKPSKLRELLKVNHPLGVTLEKAPRPCLRKRQWIEKLLHYCLSDGCKDLHGLPLAILADGTLQAFAHNPPGFIYYTENDVVRSIFTNYPTWFLDPKLVEQVPKVKEKNGLLEITPVEVGKRLSDVMRAPQAGGYQWQPDANTLPNAKWLAQVYHYFTQVNDLPSEQLKQLPLVPANDGRLYQGGNPQTPLLCRSNIAQEIREALKFFGILFIQAPETLQRAIEAFFRKHPKILIWNLTPPKVIDTLHLRYSQSPQNLPVFNIEIYTNLLTFLTHSDWVTGTTTKYKQETLDKLCELKIFPTTSGETVTLSDEDVYIPGEYEPPAVAGRLNILQLGTNRQWKPLLDLLPVATLDRVNLIRKFQRPGGYDNLNQTQQLEALEWIRDNLGKAQTDLDRQRKNSSVLKQELSQASLIHCTDGKLRPASLIYDPNSQVVRDVLGNRAPFPDMKEVYSNNHERWLEFFKSLGMLTSPSAKDLLDYIDSLSDKAPRNLTETVANDCLKVFNHIVQHWDELKDEKIGENNLRFTGLLKTRRWLSVERSSQSLQRFPGAMTPEARLYCPNEVAFIQDGHKVASQRPLFSVQAQPKGEIAKILDFQPITSELVVKHFDALIKLWERRSVSNINIKLFEKSIMEVYREFHRHFVVGSKDRSWLQGYFKGRPCLWYKDKFWKPEYAFQDAVPFFGEHRTRIPINPPIRDVYEVLGLKRLPDRNDYLSFLQEIRNKYGDNPLKHEDAKCVIQVLQYLDQA